MSVCEGCISGCMQDYTFQQLIRVVPLQRGRFIDQCLCNFLCGGLDEVVDESGFRQRGEG